MSRKVKPKEKVAGISAMLVLVMIIALFVVFLDMIPDVLVFIQDELKVDEFFSKILLFIALLAGIIGFSLLSMMNMSKRK